MTQNSPKQDKVASDEPLYEKIKSHIRDQITSGALLVGHRVPSENELTDALGASRMTVHRALRELAAEGLIDRVRGKGSFVALRKHTSRLESIPNIADEIKQRNSIYSAKIIFLQEEICGPERADTLDLPLTSKVFHSVIVHYENEFPIQIEDRFVNPKSAPLYMDQDYTLSTPNAYLSEIAPITRAEQFIEAVNASPWECKLLAISRTEPCLMIKRRTWSVQSAVSTVRLLYPGSRYRLRSETLA